MAPGAMRGDFGNGKRNLNLALARTQVRKAFDRYLEALGGYRHIPDSPVAVAMKKEGKGRFLAGNDERIFTFSDEFIIGFVMKEYPALSRAEQVDLASYLKEEL
jgi:hypothetical protein